MLTRLGETQDLRDFVHSLNADEAAVLASALDMNEFASGVSHPAVLKAFKFHLDANIISVGAFRETAFDIMDFGEGLTEAAIETALFRSARTVVGREQLQRLGLPRDSIKHIERARRLNDLRGFLEDDG